MWPYPSKNPLAYKQVTTDTVHRNDIHEDLWAKIGEPADLAGRNYFRPGFLYSFTPEERVNIYHRLRSKGPYGKEHLLSREAVGEFVRTLLPWTGVALRLWHCAFFPNATFAWNEPNKKTATVNVDWLIEMGKAMYPDLPDEEYDPEDETYVAKAEKIEENRMKFKQWVMGPVLSMITDKIKTWKLRGQEAWGVSPSVQHSLISKCPDTDGRSTLNLTSLSDIATPPRRSSATPKRCSGSNTPATFLRSSRISTPSLPKSTKTMRASFNVLSRWKATLL